MVKYLEWRHKRYQRFVQPRKKLSGLLPSSSIDSSIWIGANTLTPAKGDTSGWKWVDGSAFSYQNWNGGKPTDDSKSCQHTPMTNEISQSCLAMITSTGLWDDGCCSSAQFFVCQKPVKTSSTKPIAGLNYSSLNRKKFSNRQSCSQGFKFDRFFMLTVDS
jgi:hypothetical protein